MREAVIKKIMFYRSKGLGYKSIGKILGISRETVRYHCKVNGFDVPPEEVAKKIENENRPMCCKCCGGLIVRYTHSGKKIFCSDKCRRK